SDTLASFIDVAFYIVVGRLVVDHTRFDGWLCSRYTTGKVEAAMTKKYLVSLTDAERETLLGLTKKGSVAARKLTRAHILLQADAGATDETIAQALHIGTATVERIRKRFVEGGVEAALTER